MVEPEPEPQPQQQQLVDYDERYRTGWAYGKKPNAFLVEAAASWLPADRRPLRVLSLGEGQGRNVGYMAEQGHQCLAVDASSVGLEKARTLAAQRGVSELVETCVADLTAFEPGSAAGGASTERQWDVILSIFCSMPAAARVRLHQACAASLAPGGVVIYEGFAPSVAGGTADGCATDAKPRAFRPGPPESERVNGEQLAADFGLGLEVLIAREVARPLNEGRFHRGPTTLTQFVARALPLSPVAPPILPVHPLAADQLPGSSGAGASFQQESGRFACYCASVDAVFDEAATHRAGRSDAEITAAATAEYIAAAAKQAAGGGEGSEPAAKPDALLLSAKTLLSLTCAAAERGGICRYCWVPRAACFCHALAAISRGGATAQKQTAALDFARWLQNEDVLQFLCCGCRHGAKIHAADGCVNTGDR